MIVKMRSGAEEKEEDIEGEWRGIGRVKRGIGRGKPVLTMLTMIAAQSASIFTSAHHSSI